MIINAVRMKHFYARCSSKEGSEAGQISYAKELGFEDSQIYIDRLNGKNAHRSALLEMLSRLSEGDEVFFPSFLSSERTPRDLLDLMERLNQAHVNLHSEKEGVDTFAPAGKLVFHLFACIADFQKQIVLDNAAEGQSAAKAQGKPVGHPKVDQDALDSALHMFQSDLEKSIVEICDKTGIGRSALYRAADEKGVRRASHLLNHCTVKFESSGRAPIISRKRDTQENQS